MSQMEPGVWMRWIKDFNLEKHKNSIRLDFFGSFLGDAKKSKETINL